MTKHNAATVAPRELPILFSRYMTLALSDGKTQTRRVITPQNTRLYTNEQMVKPGPDLLAHAFLEATGFRNCDGIHIWKAKAFSYQMGPQTTWMAECTVRPGDLLWVKRHRFQKKVDADIWLRVTAVRCERLQDISEADAIAEGMDLEMCEAIFHLAAGKHEATSDMYWLEHPETGAPFYDADENIDFCEKCANDILEKHPTFLMSTGSCCETDGSALCGSCGVVLNVSLTEYGVNQQLLLDMSLDDARKYFPASGVEARILQMLASGIGDLQDRHHGRLAQIGFATYWDSLNAKRGYSWDSNPPVWVYTFERAEKPTNGVTR